MKNGYFKMKKLLLILSVLVCLTACGQKLEPADISGAWENSAATVYFGEDCTYEIRYADFGPGELSSENGEFGLSGGKIELRMRDKYTLDDSGEISFERLPVTEDRKADVALDGDTLTLDGTEYVRREEG